MKAFQEFLNKMDNLEHRGSLEKTLRWVHEEFPELEMAVKWNQPMFLDHGTYIMAFSVAKAHFSLSPEAYALDIFREKAEKIGYKTTKMLIKVKWTDPVDYDFIGEMIRFNIKDKKECQSFWRQ